MEITPAKIAGCFGIQSVVRADNRGSFLKLFQKSVLADSGIDVDFVEVLSSRSKAGVVRGLHFQRPPFAQSKLVYCLEGEIEDVVFDARQGSPTYGQFETFRLSAEQGNAVFMPIGIAHGFAAITDATVVYMAGGGEYNAESDGGIHWDSVGIEWPVANPILSDKDQGLPKWDGFDTPFTWSA